MPESDVDLGLYYWPPLDVQGLQALAQQVAGSAAQLTRPGGWGPWVDGGGWLRIDGTAVDWLYRDLDRVQDCWAAAQAGRTPSTRRWGIRWECRTSPTRASWRSRSSWPTRPAR